MNKFLSTNTLGQYFVTRQIVWVTFGFFHKLTKIMLVFLVIRYFFLSHSFIIVSSGTPAFIFWAAGKPHFLTWHWCGCSDPSLAMSLFWWLCIRYRVLILPWNLTDYETFFSCTLNIFFGSPTIVHSLAFNKIQQIEILSWRQSYF